MLYNILSKNAVLKSNYEKGQPIGSWEYLKTTKKSGEGEIVVQDIQVSFKNGQLNGDLFSTISDSTQKVVISGQVINGLFDGIWKFSYDTLLEIRNYDRGILLDLLLLNGEDSIHFLEFPLSEKIEELLKNPNQLSILAHSSGKLNFRDGYSNNSDFVTLQNQSNHYLRLMLRQLHQYDPNILDETNWSIGTYRVKYLLTDQEKVWMKQLDSVMIKYHSLLKNIEDEEILDLKYSNDDIIVLVLDWLRVENETLRGVESQVGELLANTLERTYREGMLTDSAKNYLRKSVVLVGEDTVIFKYGRGAEEEKNLLAYLLANYMDRMRVADSLQKEFLVKVKSMNIDQALILRNEKIITLINELDSSIKANTRDPSMNKLVRQLHDDYLMNIVNKEYQQYLSLIDDKEKKAIIGDSILLELHSIEEIYKLSHKIAIRRRDIDSLYTEYTFDPFTFTDMVPTRIKRKLYDIIAVQMFNEMVENATNETNPFSCEKDLRELYEFLPILITLKNRDTKKLEKKLKRHKSLEERLAILNEEIK